MAAIQIVALACLIGLATAEVKFDGDEVLRVFPSTLDHISFLQKLDSIEDFWSPLRKNGSTDVRIAAPDKAKVRQLFDEMQLPFEVFIPDLQKCIDAERKSQTRSSERMDWTSYRSVNEIHDFMTELAGGSRDIAEIFDIGRSTEGRRLRLIRIGYPAGRRKKAIWIDGGIHAREWITPAITSWFINELLTNRESYRELLTSVDFYIIPSLNPDGYEYTRSNNRMWRKTRSRPTSGRCQGVDPNRNYDEHFGGEGTSTDPCSEIYHGPRAFSEPETAAVRDFIRSRRDMADWQLYVAMHSYSQMILMPWGWSDELPPNYEAMKSIGEQAGQAIEAVYGTQYQVGRVTELLYAAAGASDDWAHRFHFRYSYTIEVRDTGRYGFILPASQIIPTAQETWQGILVMANAVA